MASQSTLDFNTFHNVIDGTLTSTPETRHNLNPSTLEANPDVPVSSQEDVDRAVKAAQRAFLGWSDIPIEDRRNAVRKYADAVEKHIPDFATMLVKEQGKPLGTAQMELGDAMKTLREIADLPFEDEVREVKEGKKSLVRYVPIGVVVGIVPWNFPISTATLKAATALITGNTFILKSSPFTPYCDLKLAELAIDFFPPGVFQALSGDDSLGPMLTAHPGVGKVTFTGSVATGMRVMESCSRTMKRITLELGGNDPAIVCDDVNIQEAAQKVAMFSMFNSGQVCIAIKRVYVHASIYDQFLATLAAIVGQFPVGDGFSETTFIGPLQNSMQYERVKKLLADIESSNLKIANPETAKAEVPGKGYFIQPTIIDNPPDNSNIVAEEQFGPVIPVMKWTDEADVISRANDSSMGLGASVWTADTTRAERISKKLQAGIVWVNTHVEVFATSPMSGHKHSGNGVELGVEGLRSCCNIQTVQIV